MMRAVVPLPTADQIRADMQRMVDFGPRLDRLPGPRRVLPVDRRRDAGRRPGDRAVRRLRLRLLPDGRVQPRDPRRRRGRRGRRGDVLRPIGRHPARRGDRSARRSPPGSRRPTSSRRSSIRTPPPRAVREWVASVPDGTYRDAILLVELSTPGELNAGVFTALSTYLQWDGTRRGRLGRSSTTRERGWDRGSTSPTSPRSACKGVVFTTRASKEMLRGNNSPHIARPQPLPALVVDRDTGAVLRAAAEHRPQTRLRLDVTVEPVQLRQLTAILPGASDECIIVNTHTDGQNAFEENGAVAAVAMARHFASLPTGAAAAPHAGVRLVSRPHVRPRRHRGPPRLDPQAPRSHRARRRRGQHRAPRRHRVGRRRRRATDPPARTRSTASGRPRATMFEQVALPALVESGLQRHSLLKPPVQITPGRAFHWLGVPHVSGIAGPTYLLKVTDNGEMDKFDADARRPPDRLLRRRRTAPRQRRPSRPHRGDPTLGQDGGAEEEQTYRDVSTTVPAG